MFKKLQTFLKKVDLSSEKIVAENSTEPLSTKSLTSAKKAAAAADPTTQPSQSALVDAKRAWMIRRREFGKLRFVRQQMLNADVSNPPLSPRFSATTTMLRDDERHSTIQKIDEIEAQMSMQWWKTDRLDLRKDR